MVAASSTFIDAWLKLLGFENIFANQQRYPEVDLKQLQDLKPDFVFLPDEPYHFKEKERCELQEALPETRVLCVDGAPFCWFGTGMLAAAHYFQELNFASDALPSLQNYDKFSPRSGL